MPDVKKLITGFLILAAGASSSALILSEIGSQQINPAPATDTTQTTPALLNGNAFADNQNNAYIADADTTDQPTDASATAALDDPNNLTNALADAYLTDLVSDNPNGVTTNPDGSQSVAPPDSQTVLDGLAGNKALSQISIPNWDIEAADQPLDITNLSSPSDVVAYATALQAAFNQYFISTGLQSMAQSNSDPTDVDSVSSDIQGALQEIADIPTPAPAANFQRSLVKLLVYEKNIIALAENPSDDPVKNSIILENEKAAYNAAVQDVATNMQQLSTLGGFSFGEKQDTNGNGAVALLDNTLGIQTAHAIFGVGDITFDPAVFGQWVLQFAEDTALQIMKNTLVAIIQQEVLKWVQGNGTPRFIQNWATGVVNAFQQTALNYLNSQMQCVNPAFANQLRLTLTSYYQTGNNICSAQFQSALNSGNLQQFYNRFSNGGFVTFGQTLQPTNDYYSQLLFTSQSVGNAGTIAQASFLGQSISAQGFTGSQTCTDGSNPNGLSNACVGPSGDVVYPNPGGGCDPGYVLKPTPNNGLCGNGSYPLIATPGNVTAQGFGVALDTSPKLITAATTIVGLLSSLTTSLLSTLAQAAIKYSSQVVNGALASGGGSGSNPPQDTGITGLSSSSTITVGALPPQPAAQCSPSAQTFTLGTSTSVTASLYGSGGAIDFNCATNSADCTPGENTDGTPSYSWTAPGATSIGGGANSSVPFNATYSSPGTYYVTVTASTDNTSSTCQIIVN